MPSSVNVYVCLEGIIATRRAGLANALCVAMIPSFAVLKSPRTANSREGQTNTHCAVLPDSLAITVERQIGGKGNECSLRSYDTLFRCIKITEDGK